MNVNELMAKLRSAGLYPIRVEGSAFSGESGSLTFIGDLDMFIEAAITLKTDVVFVSVWSLPESEFSYSLDDIDDEEFKEDMEENEPAEIYLPAVMPTLDRFKDYIGNDGAFKISVPMPKGNLDFFVQEGWCSELIDLLAEAVAKVKHDRATVQAAQAAERESRERELLDRLRNLINDSNFTRLSTQITMQAYALEKIPELETLSESTLKKEIQALDAKIKAKGLSRKH